MGGLTHNPTLPGKIVILRDVLALVATGFLVAAAFGNEASTLQWFAGIGLVLSTFICHEWGHWLGATCARAHLHAATSWWSLSLFRFGTENPVAAFAMMSLGGFAVTAVAVMLAWTVLPPDAWFARIARFGISALATLTLVIEVPLFLYGLAKRRTPEAVATTLTPVPDPERCG